MVHFILNNYGQSGYDKVLVDTTAHDNGPKRVEAVESERLGDFEAEIIELFVRMAQIVGLPKSIGQIYGLIFASPKPIDFDTIVRRLAISKGSASQGLRFLRSAGAVNGVSVPGRRSEHYVPETSLRALVSGFLKEQIEPHLDNGVERLAKIRELSAGLQSGDQDVLASRIDRLEMWRNRAVGVLPFALRFLGR